MSLNVGIIGFGLIGKKRKHALGKKVFSRRKRRKTQKIDDSNICDLKMTSITFLTPS